ncbi:E3 ubiquitin-protein ligase RNF213-like [Dreissena polymorpha]|uniref:Fibronectin type-III domain-containing protein n=1 Tax=Dreissena polymorpha TaxID=45954 RepID=A0A9D4FZ82_DREPO|nr:E3 ubiquitin-protein ligase RNF213-like [Dreissena polymorpha]KAH3807136.1 hypothetical protein DPMN_135469 [Dreissena polymorpha]
MSRYTLIGFTSAFAIVVGIVAYFLSKRRKCTESNQRALSDLEQRAIHSEITLSVEIAEHAEENETLKKERDVLTFKILTREDEINILQAEIKKCTESNQIEVRELENKLKRKTLEVALLKQSQSLLEQRIQQKEQITSILQEQGRSDSEDNTEKRIQLEELKKTDTELKINQLNIVKDINEFITTPDVEVDEWVDTRDIRQTPGRPIAIAVALYSITIYWECDILGDDSYYQLHFKEDSSESDWIICEESIYQNTYKLTNLKCNYGYFFRVRVHNDVKEGPFSEVSEVVQTFNISSPGMIVSRPQHQQSSSAMQDAVAVEEEEEDTTEPMTLWKNLLMQCVKPALLMIKDHTNMEQREKERCDIVQTILSSNTACSNTFMNGLIVLLEKLLKEKEHVTGYYAIPWKARDTADNQIKLQTCENNEVVLSGVTNVIAGMIAFLDINNNIDLIMCEYEWKRDFLLLCLNNMDLLTLRYIDIQKWLKEQINTQQVVDPAGIETHRFKLRFPFSWVIMQHVDDLFKEHILHVHEMTAALHSGAIGQDLSHITSMLLNRHDYESGIAHLNNALRDYIHDFVHTVYNADGEAELNIVCQKVYTHTINLCYPRGEIPEIPDIIRLIVCVRFAFEELAWQLTNFRNVNYIWPDCSEKIEGIRLSNPDHFMFKEHEFTHATLCLLIEQLNPTSDELNDRSGQLNWLERVNKYRTIVEPIIQLKRDDVIRYGCHSPASVRRAKCMWSRVLVMKLFLEDVCTGETQESIRIKDCMPLWAVLGEETDLKDIKSFAALEKFLHICNTEDVKDAIGLGKVKQETYQKQRNTFFFHVVTQLCFADDDLPTEEVFGKLLDYVTCTAKKRTLYTRATGAFDSIVDLDHVLRSYLLQMMLNSSKRQYVSNYLRRYIEEVSLCEEGKRKETVDMYVMITQCWENIQLQLLNQNNESKLIPVQHLLENTLKVMNTPASQYDLLLAIATTRACIQVAAQCLQRCYAQDCNIEAIPAEDEGIIQVTKSLFDHGGTHWPRAYLVRLFCRRYGVDVYQRLASKSLLQWLAIDGMDQRKEVCDRYITGGEVYIEIRETVSRTVLGEDIKTLDELLHKVRERGEPVETFIQLAIHREITCSKVRLSGREHTNGLPKLIKYLEGASIIKNKGLIVKLVNNELQPDILKMTPECDMMTQGLQCLLAHFYFVVSNLQVASTLLDPLIVLTNGNPIIQDMFLPTMPQDDLPDIKNIVCTGRDEQAVLYKCPNGHPYLIGDCGRPYVSGSCPACREKIGGDSHTAHPGNVIINSRDTTKPGHILGRANNGVDSFQSVRDLNTTYCTATRLLLHMAMYFGPVQQVTHLITPGIDEDNVQIFLLDHIRNDISNLKKALGRSDEDVLLLMHIAINSMLRLQDTTVSLSVAKLATKTDRQEWETLFSTRILQDVLGHADSLITNWNDRLATDQRLGADPLMRFIFETDGMEDGNQILNIPRLWRVRSSITIERMRQDLESKGQSGNTSNPMLQTFMNEDCLLQALKYLPNIIRLHRALLQKYQKKLTKTDANEITVKRLKMEWSAGEGTEQLMDWIYDFARAWDITRKTLEQHGCTTAFGRICVPKEFCKQQIHDDTPLAVFLPATNGPGLCSYAMVDFLLRKHNDFLDYYIRKSERTVIRHPTTKPMDITSAHLICYDHEHDIMALVVSNCHYMESFEKGGETIVYDLSGMQRKLIDRLLVSKSIIYIRRFLEIDLMTYKTEVTNHAVFMKLGERIPQAHLNKPVQNQICKELKSLTDVYRSLDDLDIAISVLKTTGGDPRAHLITFMVETLHIQDAIVIPKVNQCCELQHARSLWLLLAFHKSKLLLNSRQSIEAVFEIFQSDMLEDIDGDLERGFTDYINALSVGELETILEAMHEFLLLSVSIRQNTDDEDFIDTSNYRFVDGLREYVDQNEQAFTLDALKLENFPMDILYKHGAKAWVLACETWNKTLGNEDGRQST